MCNSIYNKTEYMADISTMAAMSMSTMGAHERQVWETLEAVGEVA